MKLPRPKPSQAPSRTHPTILVVDDQAGQRAILDALLTLDGYEVITLDDGQTALEYLRANTPHLIILDVIMPFLGGLELCRRLKRLRHLAEVPVILLTAARDEKTLAKAHRAQVDRVMHKPLESSAFRRAVRELLAARV